MGGELVTRGRLTALVILFMAVLVSASLWTWQRGRKVLFPGPVDVVKRSQELSKKREMQIAVARPVVAPDPELAAQDATPAPEEMSAEQLEEQLHLGFQEAEYLDLEAIEQNIQLADALIDQEPQSYHAHKAKLLALLAKELRFGKTVDPLEYQDLYEKLLGLQGEEESGQEVPPELAGMDPVLVHVPFLRLAAQGDFQGLAKMAQDYVESYPESFLGHMYLAEAELEAGDQAAALANLRKGLGKDLSDGAIMEVLQQLQEKPPLERILQMRPLQR